MSDQQKPTVPDVLPLVQAYYKFPSCGVGGSLHIVLDDGNIEDGHIEYCIECAKDPEFWVCQKQGGPDICGELLGRILLRMSKTQRSKVSNIGGYEGVAMPKADFIARCHELLGEQA